MTTTATTDAVLAEIGQQQTLAAQTIDSLRSKIAQAQPTYLAKLTRDMQGELAYLDTLDILHQQLTNTFVIIEGDPVGALLRVQHDLALDAVHLTTNTAQESKEAVQGRATALRVAINAVYYALQDITREGKSS